MSLAIAGTRTGQGQRPSRVVASDSFASATGATSAINPLNWLKDRHPTHHLSELYALHTEDTRPSIDPRLVEAPTREIAGRPPEPDSNW